MKHPVEVTMIPLNGVRPIIYNIEIDLLATASELKKDIIKLMTKHCQRMRYVLHFYFKQIEQTICKSGHHKENLSIIPHEIIDLCGIFYDQCYSMSVNLKSENLAILAKSNYIYKITDQLIEDDMIIYAPDYPGHDGMTKLNIYQCFDDKKLNKYLKLNNAEYQAIQIYHCGQTLVIKVPTYVFIHSSTVIDMVKKKLQPYVKQKKIDSTKDVFDLYIGNPWNPDIEEIALTQLYGIFVINDIEDGIIYPVKDSQDKESVIKRFKNDNWFMKCFDHRSITMSIQLKWHEEAFCNEIFKNAIDTCSIKNHVYAMDYDDNEIDIIHKIQTMFD